MRRGWRICSSRTTSRWSGIADRVGVMYLGKLVETGPAAAVFASPLHPYTRGLLDTAEHADPGVRPSVTPLGGETPSAAGPPSGCRFRTRCPHARDLCAREEPVPAEAAVPGHTVACHVPLAPAVG